MGKKNDNGFVKFLKTAGQFLKFIAYKIWTALKLFFSIFKKDFKKETTTMLEWKKDGGKAVACLAPILIILCIFTFYPIAIFFYLRHTVEVVQNVFELITCTVVYLNRRNTAVGLVICFFD